MSNEFNPIHLILKWNLWMTNRLKLNDFLWGQETPPLWDSQFKKDYSRFLLYVRLKFCVLHVPPVFPLWGRKACFGSSQPTRSPTAALAWRGMARVSGEWQISHEIALSYAGALYERDWALLYCSPPPSFSLQICHMDPLSRTLHKLELGSILDLSLVWRQIANMSDWMLDPMWCNCDVR